MAEKTRLDIYLYENGMAESREKAKALIIAGEVSIDGRKCDKPSALVGGGQAVEVRKAHDYVSRGGKKLEKALDYFNISVSGKVAADVGASTGGFTDCLLKRGAKHVFAVDVGHGQLAWSLRQDSRVCVMERTNARTLKRDMFDREINFACADVSFISLKLIIPAIVGILTAPFEIVALIKPQFEAGKENVGKKGVVRDKHVHAEVISNIIGFAESLGIGACGLTYSPIKGPEGNIEYLIFLRNSAAETAIDVSGIVEQAHSELD